MHRVGQVSMCWGAGNPHLCAGPSSSQYGVTSTANWAPASTRAPRSYPPTLSCPQPPRHHQHLQGHRVLGAGVCLGLGM